jgi:hypothetical protein
MPGFDLDAFVVDLREAALREDADKSVRGLIKGALAGDEFSYAIHACPGPLTRGERPLLDRHSVVVLPFSDASYARLDRRPGGARNHRFAGRRT